jgi:2-haloacid dehalogenase
MKIRALIFDAYGTLFDVHSVVQLCEELWPGYGQRLSQLWRSKQLEYTWQRSLMRRYENFGLVTQASLSHACAALGLDLDDDRKRRLMEAYLNLRMFPDARAALSSLKTMGLKLAILSNGSPAMLRPLVANAGLLGTIKMVISVDELGTYKPAPAVYRRALSKLQLSKKAVGFVSSNCWDACGAKSFGLTSFWINRGNAPLDELGAPPDRVLERLDQLPDLLGKA